MPLLVQQGDLSKLDTSTTPVKELLEKVLWLWCRLSSNYWSADDRRCSLRVVDIPTKLVSNLFECGPPHFNSPLKCSHCYATMAEVHCLFLSVAEKFQNRLIVMCISNWSCAVSNCHSIVEKWFEIWSKLPGTVTLLSVSSSSRWWSFYISSLVRKTQLNLFAL